MLRLCIGTYVAIVMHYVCEQENKMFDLKNSLLFKKLLDTPIDKKYFTTNNFHTKISNSEFSQTTIVTLQYNTTVLNRTTL